MNQDLGRINTLLEKKPIKKKHSERLQRKYNMKMKGLKVVREEIKQRIKAKVGKITRYQNRYVKTSKSVCLTTMKEGSTSS